MKKGSKKYLAALIVLFIGLMLISGCSAYTEILPNLCHSDSDVMIICDCPEEDITYHGHCIEKEEIELFPACEIWRNVDDPSAYMNCIQNQMERAEFMERMA